MYKLIQHKDKKTKEKLARQLVKIYAQEEKAKRLQMLWSSTFLATQYFINATSKETQSSLRDIYSFLGGVNLIVIGYAYFYRDKYESFYYKNPKNEISFSPALFNVNNKKLAGFMGSFNF